MQLARHNTNSREAGQRVDHFDSELLVFYLADLTKYQVLREVSKMAFSGHAAAEIEAVSAEDSFHDILLPATHDVAVVDLQADESAAQSRPSSSGKWTGVWRALTTGQHKRFAIPLQICQSS